MTALDLGGTLFLPATHKNVEKILLRKKYVNLKSLLIDTEDSLNDLESGLQRLSTLLKTYTKDKLLVFIRPRNVEVLKKILTIKNIEKVDGFILPKFSLDNAYNYLELLEATNYKIMPSIEGTELFEQSKLIALKDILLSYKEKVPLIRFGLEDMLRQLKMKRSCEDSIFDTSVTSFVLATFIGTFKSAGFDVSGGVYPCFEDKEGFVRDVKRDLKEGLLSKTIIHPQQIEIINTLYKVKQLEYEEAKEICESTSAVFNQNGRMAEKSTMYEYAMHIMHRAKIYGVYE